ncbi:hypothetical protein IF1G_05654 [Cordyceps javanica]|uniref:Uncharacterized protein n=1 Tax=Cordyceps javanica TaxID=43265 RepID=A0A545V271_9HYPO|nr:hypothetical protein IF1G_05654 [Cordyceps javanica]
MHARPIYSRCEDSSLDSHGCSAALRDHSPKRAPVNGGTLSISTVAAPSPKCIAASTAIGIVVIGPRQSEKVYCGIDSHLWASLVLVVLVVVPAARGFEASGIRHTYYMGA